MLKQEGQISNWPTTGKKTDLTLTGLLMEGLGSQNLSIRSAARSDGKIVVSKAGEACGV